MSDSKQLGTEKIGKLLFRQAMPAALGFMVMSVNMVVDTYYVGQYIGKLAIGAISIAMPISFLISSFGLAVGIGGASIVSRSLGEKNYDRAQRAFNNQISLTTVGSILVILLSFVFKNQILRLFGAQGELVELTDIYFTILLLGIPFLTGAMMANSNLRAEGKARLPMIIMFVISISNILLDHLFIVQLDWGMEGAAWATTSSYMMGGITLLLFYLVGNTELKVRPAYFKLEKLIVKEIFSIGVVTFVRQGSISILMIVLNHSLFYYGNMNGVGGENAVSIFGIVNRINMFAFFPLIGISQGLMPIVGYNYGARNFDRVKKAMRISLISGFLIAACIASLLLMSSSYIPRIFTNEKVLLEHTPKAIFWMFLVTPLLIFQLAGASYFQAIGKGLPALLLTLTKHSFFLVPVVLLLPLYLDLEGIWYSFPIADFLAASVCFYFLTKGLKKLK